MQNIKISIMNIKDTNGLISVDNSSEAVNELDFDSQEDEEVVGMKDDSNISVDENLESIEVTEKPVDEGDVKKTKTETLTIDNIQTVAEKLGISVSISGSEDARDLKAESPERSSTNNQEEIKTNQSQSTAWCLETLLGNGAISVAKFVPEENEKEDEENFDSVEVNGINVESEKEKTVEDHTETRFLSSDEENFESESPLERLVSSGLLSINKIENDSIEEEDLEQIITEDDCVRYACSFCEFVSFRKDTMEEHIFKVHEVAGRPLKQNMVVKMTETFIPGEEEEEAGTEMTALNSITNNKSTESDNESFIESNLMEDDEAFNSDEEFDDDDDDDY